MGQQGKIYLLGSSRITREWPQVTKKSRPCPCLGAKSPKTPKIVEWEGRAPRLRQPAELTKSIKVVLEPHGASAAISPDNPTPLKKD